jgi:hypothetical protein
MSKESKINETSVDSELSDQDLAAAVGGTGSTTIGPSGPSSVSTNPVSVLSAGGTDSTNPGWKVDPFTGSSTGQTS